MSAPSEQPLVEYVSENKSVRVDGVERSVGNVRVDPSIVGEFDLLSITEETVCDDYSSIDLFDVPLRYQNSGKYLVGKSVSSKPVYDHVPFVVVPCDSEYVPDELQHIGEVTDDAISQVAIYYPHEELVIVKREVGVEHNIIGRHYVINHRNEPLSTTHTLDTIQFHTLGDQEIVDLLPEEYTKDIFCEVI